MKCNTLNFDNSQAQTYSVTINEIINKWGFAVQPKNLYMKGYLSETAK